uniref:Uncharacterized protein n=1 Tax=Anopheles culicifacies TaxID=139723 RepID=A0A182MQU3_9DIPT
MADAQLWQRQDAVKMALTNKHVASTVVYVLVFSLREEANKKRKKQQQQQQQQQQRQRQRRGAKVFRGVSCNSGISHLTLGPSRLFEKTPMSPSDSLDEIALQIPSLQP